MKTNKHQDKPLLIMAMVRLDFKDLKPFSKTMQANKIVNKMAGNLFFPNPTPSLAAMSTAINNLDIAQRNINGTKLNYIIRNNAVKKLDSMIRQLRSYVENTANGDAEIICSSGFDVRNARIKAHLYGQTVISYIRPGGFEGTLEIRCRPLKNCRHYQWQRLEDVSSGVWVNLPFSTKASTIVTGMIPGKMYYFRVAGANSAGVGAFSGILGSRSS